MSSLLTNDHPYFLSQYYQESYLISHGTLFVYVLCFAKGKRRGRRATQRTSEPPPSYVLRPGYVARFPFRSHYKFIRLWHATKRNWILAGFLIRIQIPKRQRLRVTRGMGSAFKLQKSKRMTE